ncbi:hypothetical protein [Microcoleus sp. FACHB-68]|uniref:hypothetical protein n=1 Tax=Microcoleus sp. FACHB-68 TaxID=2692826 RepID=UPI001687A44D|nr:hypothetical protein [Microcoleus sp. FACHB-68]MBD1939104.1 hypothetical protein [Microcoleus sp. FACHB-68]
MNQTDYENMKVAELTAICKGNAKYANYSRCGKKVDLIAHMVNCDKAEAKAQQAVEQSAPVTPGEGSCAAAAAGSSKAAIPATTWQHYNNLTLEQLRDICKADGVKYAHHWGCTGRKQLMEFMLACEGVENPADWPPGARPPKPAALTHIKVTPEEYLDDVAMPAPFWSCQITNSLTWGRWRFGEGQSRQHGKYLSIACSELGRHWIILWDWHSFESACKELIYGLTRLGEAAFLPSPGYLPAPPAEDEEPADDKDGDKAGGDPRRERQNNRQEPDPEHCEPDSEHCESDSEHKGFNSRKFLKDFRPVAWVAH